MLYSWSHCLAAWLSGKYTQVGLPLVGVYVHGSMWSILVSTLKAYSVILDHLD